MARFRREPPQCLINLDVGRRDIGALNKTDLGPGAPLIRSHTHTPLVITRLTLFFIYI